MERRKGPVGWFLKDVALWGFSCFLSSCSSHLRAKLWVTFDVMLLTCLPVFRFSLKLFFWQWDWCMFDDLDCVQTNSADQIRWLQVSCQVLVWILDKSFLSAVIVYRLHNTYHRSVGTYCMINSCWLCHALFNNTIYSYVQIFVQKG